MQRFQIKKGSLVSKVEVPPSKSYANRALIISSIKEGPVTLSQVPRASDVEILISCLEAVGLELKRNGLELQVLNSFPSCESSSKKIHVGEGGTTARFLAVMLLLGKERYELLLGDRLKDRPWEEFLTLAKKLGAEVSLEKNLLTIQGPIHFPEVLEVDCSQTTQFATAFHLIAPKGKLVKPRNLSSSQSYWEMTGKILSLLEKESSYVVPLDWSSASYALAFGALNHEIDFPGLRPDAYQADSKFFEILVGFKSLSLTSTGLKVHPGVKEGDFEFDVSDCLDLVPTLGYYLAHIKGNHRLHGIQNLVHKESNRLEEVLKLLSTFKREARADHETLFLTGSDLVIQEEVHLSLPDDHRMVMVGTLFLLQHGGGSVSPPQAVLKSYPDFFKILKTHDQVFEQS